MDGAWEHLSWLVLPFSNDISVHSISEVMRFRKRNKDIIKHCGGSIYFLFFLYLRCLCCVMMFRWTNKQPGIQMFWNWCSHYQEIHNWTSLCNKSSGLRFILTQQSMAWGKWVYIHLVTYLFSLFWSTELCFWSAIFQGFIFYMLSKTIIAMHVEPWSSEFLKWKHC